MPVKRELSRTMRKKIELDKIYLDMDGVLADFERGVRELCNFEAEKTQDEDPVRDELMWAEIKKIDHFYSKLEPLPGAKELFDLIYGKYGEKCEILTGIPKARRGIKHSAEDKTEWVRRILSETVKVNTVFKAEKKNFVAGKGSVLIDDLEKTIIEWRESGGTGILHTDPESTLAQLKELGLL